MNRYLAEFIGTATLVFVGCAAITIGGLGAALSAPQDGSALALLPIAAAFGLTVAALAYGIGPISGCHINPAVSIGAWAAGRLPGSDLPGYIIAQVLGGIAGAALLAFVLAGKVGGYDFAAAGLGETKWSNLAVTQAFVVECVATFLFVIVILGATSRSGMTPAAGLAIGLALLVMHLAFIRATGASLNPARSLGPALLVGGGALSDVWLYLTAPPLGALLAGLLFKSSLLEARPSAA